MNRWLAILLFAIQGTCFAQNIDILIFNKNYDEALAQITQKLKIHPETELYLKQAAIFRQVSKPLAALSSLKNSISLDSACGRCLAELADLQVELGNPYQAVVDYEKAIRYLPEDINIVYKLGRALMSTENYPKAYEVFRMVRYKDSTNLVYNKQLALVAFRLDKKEEATDLYESVLERNPYDLGSYQNLIVLYLFRKDPVNLIRTSDRALYFFPENPGILLRAANSLYGLKEYVEAKPCYERYFAQKDSVFEILKPYAISLYFVDEHVAARKALEKCFALNQKDPLVNFYLGLVCKKLADFPKSIEYLNLAIAGIRSVNLDEMYHCLGQVYGLQREFEKSVEALKQAYDCNPEKSEILVEIASTYEEFKQEREPALEYYNHYLTVAGDSAVNSNFARERIARIKQPSYRIKK